MSGRGPAANTVNGVSHTFVGVGNGGYQTAAANWGSSVLSFPVSAAAGIGTAPSDSFTPQGGPNMPFTSPILAGSSCPATLGGAAIQCPYTFETMNENDWDMSISGILLFQDASLNNWLVTVDKSGAGYLLNQNSLGGFTQNDTGNHFPFIAGASPCWTLGVPSDECDRVVSLAYFKGSGASSPRYIYYWPYQQLLTGFAVFEQHRDQRSWHHRHARKRASLHHRKPDQLVHGAEHDDAVLQRSDGGRRYSHGCRRSRRRSRRWAIPR